MRNQIFISYSHKDKKWLERLHVHLSPLLRTEKIRIWDDTKLNAGASWKAEIKSAVESASVAVLLVSPDFLASDFIRKHELPSLLNAAKTEGVSILWIAIQDSAYRETIIQSYHPVNDPDKPLAKLRTAYQNIELVKICGQIKEASINFSKRKTFSNNSQSESINSSALITPRKRSPNYDIEFISTLLEVAAEYKIDKIFKLLVDRIPKLVNAKEASIFWLDLENNRVVLRETYPENQTNIGKRWYEIGEGLTGWVAATGRPLRVTNMLNKKELHKIDPNLHWTDKYGGYRNASKESQARQKAFLAVPIIIDEVTVGVLRIAKTETLNGRFTDRDEKLLLNFVKHLPAIIKKAEYLARVADFQRLIEPVFFKTHETMNTHLQWVVNFIPTILNSKGCVIFLKDEHTNSYVLKYASKGNPLEEQIGIANYKAGEGLTGWILKTGDPLLINDIQNKEELKAIHPKLKWRGKYKEFLVHHSNFLGAPIKTAEEVWGVIRLSKGRDNIPFSQDDEDLLCRYAYYLGASIDSLYLRASETKKTPSHH
jgi:transcriptional regulator with GAF, ATPase, and Fis domain